MANTIVCPAVMWRCRSSGTTYTTERRATRFRRLIKDYERLPETVTGLHFIAFACLMLSRAIPVPLSPQQPLSPRPSGATARASAR